MFTDTCESIFTGLLRDAQTDVSYDFVSPLYSYYAVVEDKAALQDVFVDLLDADQTLKAAIREKDLRALQTAALACVPDNYGSDVREICTSLGNPDLFARDAEKKLWKRIKKLVIASGVYEKVYGEPAPDPAASKPRAARQREKRFRKTYQAFVDRVNEIFRGVKGNVTADTLAAFKEHALPAVKPLAEHIQANQTSDGVSDALLLYFGTDPTWFRGLPLVDAAAVTDEKWTEFTAKEPLRDEIMKSLADVLLTVTGIDALIKSPIVAALRERTGRIMRERGITAEAFVPTSPTFDKGSIVELVQDIVAALPEITDGKVTVDDLKTLLSNAIARKDEVPEGLAEIFDPDLLDFDCFAVLIDVPGIGDLLGPLLASMEGTIKGTVGVSMFGDDVAKPAWLTRDE